MKMHRLLQKMRTNAFISTSFLYILSSFIVKGISFVTTPIFTRMMGTADFGIVSNFTIWEQVLATFICLQVSSGLLPAKVTHAEDRFDAYVKNITIIALASAIIQSSFIIMLSKPIGQVIKIDAGLLPLLCVCGLGVAMTNICSGYYIASNRPKSKVWFSIITALITVILGLTLVYFSSDKSIGRIWGFTIAYICVIIFGLVTFLKGPLSSKKDFRLDAKYALAFGIPLIPHLLANLVNGSADRVFIINICGESQAGIYSVAYSIGQIALVFATACSDAWNPWYFSETKKNTISATKEISIYFKLYTLSIGMCFIGVMLLAPEIMKIMAPREYWSGTSCIIFVAVGIFFLFMYRFPLAYEQLNSNTRYVAPATIIAAGVNLALNALLIPHYGINGAAIATALSYICLWIIHEIVARIIICNYNIRLRAYWPSIILVISSFCISELLLSKTLLLRICFFALYCLAYVGILYGSIRGNRAFSYKSIKRKK